MGIMEKGPEEWLRAFVAGQWPGESEEHQVRGIIWGLCRAILERNERGIERGLDVVNQWDVFIGPDQRIVHRPGDPWGFFELERVEDQKPETEAQKARTIFVNLLLSRPDDKVAKAILGIKEVDMVSTGQLARLTGVDIRTVQNRIVRAEKEGRLKTLEVIGGRRLLELEEGLQVAKEEVPRGRPKNAPSST